MKKFLALILALAMILSIAACGANEEKAAEEPVEEKSETAEEASAPETELDVPEVQTDAEIGGYKIGFFYMPDSDELSSQYRAALQYCAEVTNCEIEVVDMFTWSSDELVAAVETLVSNGCDGIIMVSGSSPSLFEYLNEEGVYYCGMTRSHTDEVALVTDDSEYCTGWINEDAGVNYDLAYEMIKNMSEEGVKKFAYAAGAPGVSLSDDNVRGVEDAAEDFGMEILTSYRGSDFAAGLSDILASYGTEIDALAGVGVSGDIGVAALQTAGLSDSVMYSQLTATSDNGANLEAGRLAFTAGGNNVFIVQMYMQLFNAISGADRLYDDGDKVFPMMPVFSVTSAEEWEMVEKYVQGEIPGILPEELLALCSHYYPDTTVEEKEALVEKYCSSEYWNIEAIASRVGPYLGE